MVNKAIIQSVIFDLGNVIIPLHDEVQWWNVSWSEIFYNPENMHLLRAQDFFVHFERGDWGAEQFYERLTPLLKPEKSIDDIRLQWNSLLGEIPDHRWDFLRKLKKQYPIHLLSNTNSVHLDHIIESLVSKHQKDLLEDTFDNCFYSYKMGAVKPHLDIYQQVVDTLGLEPESLLFIDDKAANVEAAQSLGMQAIQIHPSEDISEMLSFLLS